MRVSSAFFSVCLTSLKIQCVKISIINRIYINSKNMSKHTSFARTLYASSGYLKLIFFYNFGSENEISQSFIHFLLTNVFFLLPDKGRPNDTSMNTFCLTNKWSECFSRVYN